MSSEVEAELVETVDEFAELIADMLNHCGPLSPTQKRTIRVAVDAWQEIRERLVEE